MVSFLFDESSVRLHYTLLNHVHVTELRFIKKGMFPVCKIVKNEESFVTACRHYNGKRNVYVGLRDRRPTLRSCGKAEDIAGIQSVALDIDPIRKADTPSTRNELHNAIRFSKIIAEWFKGNGYIRPIVAVTGNGCCLYFFLPFRKINNRNRFSMTRSVDNFERWVRGKFKSEMVKHNCVIDSMYDLPRIVRVVGTFNVKGKNTNTRPWRLSYWLSKKTERLVDEKLLRLIQRF